jgi:hypothetical protein
MTLTCFYLRSFPISLRHISLTKHFPTSANIEIVFNLWRSRQGQQGRSLQAFANLFYKVSLQAPAEEF